MSYSVNVYQVGDYPVLSYSFTANGVATDPNKVVLTMTEPDGVVTAKTWLLAGGGDSASFTHPSTGTIAYEWPITKAGSHKYVFASYVFAISTTMSVEAEARIFAAQ